MSLSQKQQQEPGTSETWSLSLKELRLESSTFGNFQVDGFILLQHETEQPRCGQDHIHTDDAAEPTQEEEEGTPVGQMMAMVRGSNRIGQELFLEQVLKLAGVPPEVRERHPYLNRRVLNERRVLAMCLWGLHRLAGMGMLEALTPALTMLIPERRVG